MKKVLAVLLSLVMVLAFTSCGGGSKAGGSIVGSWTGSIDFGKIIESEMGEFAGAMDFEEGKYMLGMNLEFTEDGKYTAAIGTEEVKAVIRELAEPLVNMYLGELAGMEGVDTDGFTEQIMGALEEQLNESELTSEGNYQLDGDKVILDGNWDDAALTFDGDKIVADIDDLGTIEFTRN